MTSNAHTPSAESDALLDAAILAVVDLESREADPSVEQYARAVLAAAAARWTQGGWSDVMLPKPTPPAVPVIAYSNRVGDWLRGAALSTPPAGGGERG